MADIKDRAREYLAEHSEYSEVFGQTFIAVDTLTAMIEFAEQETKELKKNYEDSLVACGVLKNKVDLLAQPSPLESMQDVLITTQKITYKKQKEQLTKAKELLKRCYENYVYLEPLRSEIEQFLNSLEKEITAYLNTQTLTEPREKCIAELRKDYIEAEEDNNKLRENIPKLAEAKEIIKTFLAIANNDVEYVQNPQDCKDFWKELCDKAEQFLKR